MISKVKAILISGVLLYGLSTNVPFQERRTKTLYFDDEICLKVNLTAPEIVDMQTARRPSLHARRGIFLESTSFHLAPPSTTSDISLRFRSARSHHPGNVPSNFGECGFTDGFASFQKQIDGNGFCSTGSSSIVYHSQPGTIENVTVRCTTHRDTFCEMALVEVVGAIRVGVNISTLENPPSGWVSIAKEVRRFIKDRVSALPQCQGTQAS